MDTEFKQQVREDFAEVLLNTEEFGRICCWNGMPLKIAEDARKEDQAYQTQGINKDSMVIYCRDVDLTPSPEVTEEVMLDGKRWYVEDVRKPFGYLIISLTRNVA